MGWHDGNDGEGAFCAMGGASGRQQMGKAVCWGQKPFLGDGKRCRRSQGGTEEGATVGVPGEGVMGVRGMVRWDREMGKRALWWQRGNRSA